MSPNLSVVLFFPFLMILRKAVTALVMILISQVDDLPPGIFIHLNELGWNKGCKHDCNLLKNVWPSGLLLNTLKMMSNKIILLLKELQTFKKLC